MARLSKVKIAQRLAEQAIPDGAGGMSRKYTLLARMGAAQMMVEAVVGHDLNVWTEQDIVAKMQARLVLWSNSVAEE